MEALGLVFEDGDSRVEIFLLEVLVVDLEPGPCPPSFVVIIRINQAIGVFD